MMESHTDEVQIVPFTSGMTTESVRLLARAYLTNRLHVSALGASEIARNETFFRILFNGMKGPRFVAMDGEKIVGFIHWVASPGCQTSSFEKLRRTLSFLNGLGVSTTPKVNYWLSEWDRHDPHEPHAHLGPLAVSPDMQHHRIGYQLMTRFCREIDKTGETGHLVTDRPRNLDFYKRFDFEVTAEIPIHSVMNYFMRRRPRTIRR